MKKLIWINQLLNFYVNIFPRIQHWHWLIFIVVQQILAWQYSMMNYNQKLMDQSHGTAFQTWSGVPLGNKKQCFVKRHSTTLTNHMQESLPVHLVVNAFWVQMVNKELLRWKIDDLPSEFLLTDSQKERLTTLPQYIVENHMQVVNHNGSYYHLNPDLVFDVNQIVLCHVCAENPMTKDQESIAAGNDYGDLAVWNHWMVQPGMHVYQFNYTTLICKYELIILQTILLHFQWMVPWNVWRNYHVWMRILSTGNIPWTTG